MTPRRFARPSLLWLLLVVLAAGCGLTVRQRAAVDQFGAATVDFATVASAELVRSRTDVIDMNTLRAKLGDPTFAPDALVDEHFSVARVKARTDALTALRDYGVLLQALVSTSQREQLQRAADSFVGSLRKVNGVALTDAQAGALGQAVQRVGGLVVEQMRLRAVQEIVTETQPHVTRLLELVRRDFDPNADHWSLGYQKVLVAMDGAAMRAQSRASLSSATAGGAAGGAGAPAAVDATTLALVGEARTARQRNAARFAAVSAQVLESTARLADAHRNLRYAVQSRDVSLDELRAYVAQVDELVRIYTILRDR